VRKNECLLATLPSSNAEERVVVVLVHSHTGETRAVLRQQNWAAGIGWYDQKSLALDPSQLRQLKAALGCHSHPPKRIDAEAPVILSLPDVNCIESA
jgi:hypothetical protein